MFFISDNGGPVPDAVLTALAAANTGHAMPYGKDALTAQAVAQIRTVFEAPDALVHFVATGTAANALALASLAHPWQAIFAHEGAHILRDECNAPEFFTGGAKIVGLPGAAGRIDPAAFKAALAQFASQDGTDTDAGPLSLTNVTECGTVYDPDQVSQLAGMARAHGIATHMDGARFANAVAALGCTPAELTWKSGVDALSFGGTKNGLLGVEAVIFFNPDAAQALARRRKRAGHLFSKSRYLAAQMLAYTQDDLWLSLARDANAAASRLEQVLADSPDATLIHPREANMVFARLPAHQHARLRAAGATYYLQAPDSAVSGPRDVMLGARLVCNWATTGTDIEGFANALKAPEFP